MTPKFILASNSPRRRELLSMLGIDFSIIVADCNENIGPLSPEKTVAELASRKASTVAESIKSEDDFIVLGADTVVSAEGRILGKPHSEEDARETLRFLSGKTHSVFTGIAFAARLNGKPRLVSDVTETLVTFGNISDAEIDFYIKNGEPMDKAGSYGIQGKGGFFVKGIEGDYFNVVGLPIFKMKELLLSEFGLAPKDYLGGVNI